MFSPYLLVYYYNGNVCHWDDIYIKINIYYTRLKIKTSQKAFWLPMRKTWKETEDFIPPRYSDGR